MGNYDNDYIPIVWDTYIIYIYSIIVWPSTWLQFLLVLHPQVVQPGLVRSLFCPRLDQLSFNWWVANLFTTYTTQKETGWWFGTFFIFHNIWDVILHIDELICFKMVQTTNQERCSFTYIHTHNKSIDIISRIFVPKPTE
jgi:hypothetical protein